MAVRTFFISIIFGVIIFKVQCNDIACPGVLPVDYIKHDFGGNKINVSCSYNIRVHSDNHGLILIGFRTIKLLSGDSFVIKSNGENVFGPFTESDYPTSVIVPVSAVVQLMLNPHHSGHPRTLQGYFISKPPYIYRINSIVEEDSIRSPLYKLPQNVKRVEVEYRINIKPKVSRTRNFTVWFDDISENIGSKHLQLKRQGFKDLKTVDFREDYFVGNSFGIIFKFNAEFPNEKLTVKFRPIAGDCSHEINYLNVSQIFKPERRLAVNDRSNSRFECLLIVRSSASTLKAKIKNLDLNDKLKLEVKNGSSINSAPMIIQTARLLRSVASDTGKLFLSLSGTRPIPQFEVELDCANCSERQVALTSKPESVRVPKQEMSSIPWIVCVCFGGSLITAIIAWFVYKRYTKQEYITTSDYNSPEMEIFSRRR